MAEEFVIRGAQVCLPDGLRTADVAVSGGCIAVVGDNPGGRETVDAEGMVLLPGAIDAHVHYNEPGRTDWEGWATGSLASAAGGATCVFEMPLNAHPPTLDAESFALKKAAAEASSVVDFALWGGITPANLDKLSELAACGVIGFKAFMSSSGTEDFQRSDTETLRAGMRRAAELGLPVAVHAEDEAMVSAAAKAAREAGRRSMRDYLDSRSVEAELAAIRAACELAGETGCKLHIVHVSCGEGLDEIRAAKDRGVDVTAETCPHYLVFNADDAVRIGAAAKCAPPLRSEAARADLVARVRAGGVDTLGTDHSPCPPQMKDKKDFFEVWGGIAGAQSFLFGRMQGGDCSGHGCGSGAHRSAPRADFAGRGFADPPCGECLRRPRISGVGHFGLVTGSSGLVAIRGSRGGAGASGASGGLICHIPPLAGWRSGGENAVHDPVPPQTGAGSGFAGGVASALARVGTRGRGVRR
jgi:allantoinase